MMNSEGSDTDMAAALTAQLRAELAADDRALSGMVPVLTHMLASPGEKMVSDDVLARLRGLIGSVARQLNAMGGISEPQHTDALALAIAENGNLLTHFYGLAIEGAITDWLIAERGIDPVLSTLLRELVGSKEAEIAQLAMSLMAAQARFAEGQRRADLAVFELPAGLFDEAIGVWKAWAKREPLPELAKIEGDLRAQYDEGATRIGLIERLLSAIGAGGAVVCELETAGLAIFSSAVAKQTGQQRELVLLSCQPGQSLRLALALKICGLPEEAIMHQFDVLGRAVALPDDFADWKEDAATELLAGSSLGTMVTRNE